jgi:hypothetical protein
MTQLNTPYPATAYLMGFLRQHEARLGLELAQADPALELFLRLFSRAGMTRVAARLRNRKHPSVKWFLQHQEQYLDTVDAAIRFLQGRDPSLALRIAGRELLPEGPRFVSIPEPGPASGPEPGEDPLAWAFGDLGVADRAKYLATLYVDDLADVVREGIDARFELSRYGEKLAASAPTFDELAAALASPPSLVDAVLDELTAELVARHRPDLVGLTAPFPGNVYGALRIARTVKAAAPATRVALGGGYVNTELRSLSDARVFDHLDYITLDDGERPLLALIEHLAAGGQGPLLRTFVRERGKVVQRSDETLHDVPLRDAGTPSYAGLPLDRYLSVVEMRNTMHRRWSVGRWCKISVAHGCWGR